MAVDERVHKVVSPLSAAMTGLPWHRWVNEIEIHHSDRTATFSGTLPIDIAKQVRRASLSDHDLAFDVMAEPLNSEPPAPEQVLRRWWNDQADREIEATVPKAIEYGSTDLIDIGRNVASTAGRDVTDQEAALLGIYFYLEGKLARWRSAIKEGREVSDDTLFDIGVYVRMAQRVRYAGSWPGTETP